jgi:hypothetical protein
MLLSIVYAVPCSLRLVALLGLLQQKSQGNSSCKVFRFLFLIFLCWPEVMILLSKLYVSEWIFSSLQPIYGVRAKLWMDLMPLAN